MAFALLVSETQRAISFEESPLRIWFFDVGQGDAIFLELPTGEQVLVDGGPDASVLKKLGSVMWPWDHTLDLVIPTHPDADHISGLPAVLERYEVKQIFISGAVADTAVDRAWREAVETEGADARRVSEPDAFRFGDVTLDILWPMQTLEGEFVEDRNNASVVILVTYGETRVLLTGDAEEGAEIMFMKDAGDVDVLKAGHHGSRTSSSEYFLRAVQPETVIISVGASNRYGHPHPVVLDRLERLGATMFRTDVDGDILLRSWGQEPEIRPAPLPF